MPFILRPLRAYSCNPFGANHKPAQPVGHRLLRRAFFQREGQQPARFDMAVGAGVGDDGSGAERAFGGVGGAIEFHLRAAVGTTQNAGFLDLRIRKGGVQRGLEIQFLDRRRP